MKNAATVLLLMVVAAAPTMAQTKPESLTGVERLEGDWVRIDPNGSGDFGGLASTFTPASLTPQGNAAMEAGQRQAAAPRGPASVSYTHLTLPTIYSV